MNFNNAKDQSKYGLGLRDGIEAGYDTGLQFGCDSPYSIGYREGWKKGISQSLGKVDGDKLARIKKFRLGLL